jgi:site-specific recombinase XerD
MNISESIPAWVAALKADGKSPNTIKRYRRDMLGKFIPLMGDLSIEAITPKVCRQFKVLASEGVEGGTVRLALASLNSFLEWAVDEELIESNSASRVKRPKVTIPPPKPLSQDEITAVLEAIKEPPSGPELTRKWQRNRRAILLMLYAGLRLGEVVTIKWRDIDLQRGMLTVVKGKGGKSRAVPIHPQLAMELSFHSQRRADEPVIGVGEHAIAHIFDRWLPERGIDFPISAHRLRHSFATWLYQATGDLRLTQEAMGHSTIDTTTRYTLVDASALQRAVHGLSFDA